MTVEIGYAKIGGPPTDPSRCRVFNVETGEEIKCVIEVNAVEGWCLKYHEGGSAVGMLIAGAGNSVVTERLIGKFRIECDN